MVARESPLNLSLLRQLPLHLFSLWQQAQVGTRVYLLDQLAAQNQSEIRAAQGNPRSAGFREW